MISYGWCNNGCDPSTVEGTVLDEFRSSMQAFLPDLCLFNTGKVKRGEAKIRLPSNLRTVGSTVVFHEDHIAPVKNPLSFPEVHLDIESLGEFYRDILLVDNNDTRDLAAAILVNFDLLWTEQWRSRLYAMACEWDNIDHLLVLAIEAAKGAKKAKNLVNAELSDIIDTYVAATREMLKDTEDGSEWRVREIRALCARLTLS